MFLFLRWQQKWRQEFAYAMGSALADYLPWPKIWKFYLWFFVFCFFFKWWTSKNIKSIISRNRDWRLINDCLFLFTNFVLSEILMFYLTRLKFLWFLRKTNKNDNNRRKKQSINNNVICMKRKTLNTLQYL